MPRSFVADAVRPKMSNVTGTPSGWMRCVSIAIPAWTPSRCVSPGLRAAKTARVILDVDHERVDLGRVRETDQLRELAGAKRPRVDVQGLDRFGRLLVIEERLWQDVPQLDSAELELVGRRGQLLGKKAATACRGPEQESACLPSQLHRGHQHRKLTPNRARIKPSFAS